MILSIVIEISVVYQAYYLASKANTRQYKQIAYLGDQFPYVTFHYQIVATKMMDMTDEISWKVLNTNFIDWTRIVTFDSLLQLIHTHKMQLKGHF